MNKVYVIARTEAVAETEYRNFVSPMKLRRYGRLMRRALVTAIKCMQDSGVTQPDAIINGTAMGSLLDSEEILNALHQEGESMSMPTRFMLCTHNAVATLIGIYTHNHGYNNTYSQGSVSLESALLDAFLQIKMGRISTALVCANDELTPVLTAAMRQAGIDENYYKDRSVAFMLSKNPGEHPLGEILDIRLTHNKESGDSAKIDYKKLCD